MDLLLFPIDFYLVVVKRTIYFSISVESSSLSVVVLFVLPVLSVGSGVVAIVVVESVLLVLVTIVLDVSCVIVGFNAANDIPNSLSVC